MMALVLYWSSGLGLAEPAFSITIAKAVMRIHSKTTERGDYLSQTSYCDSNVPSWCIPIECNGLMQQGATHPSHFSGAIYAGRESTRGGAAFSQKRNPGPAHGHGASIPRGE